VVPVWVWALVAVAGATMLVLWPRFRRWRADAVERVGLLPERARIFHVFSDLCFGAIAVMWTLGGLIALLRA
jgi:hypothetical protein